MTAASLRPPGLPPAALLCVRRLRDPLPGELRIDVGALRPSLDWERAAVDALTRTAAGAARPAHGPVPPGAEAVLFADRAELLAALARDWLGGELGSRWWWPLLLHVRLPTEDDVTGAWVDAAAHVPAALAILAQSRDAAPFVSRLPPPTVARIVEAVARVHAVPLVQAATVAVHESEAASPAQRASRSDRAPSRARTRVPVLPPAPWRGIVPEAEQPGLAPAASVLLGLALTLVRSPAHARTTAFASAAARRLEPEIAAELPRAPTRRQEPHVAPPSAVAVAPSSTSEPARRHAATARSTEPLREPPARTPPQDAVAPPGHERPSHTSPAIARSRPGAPPPVSTTADAPSAPTRARDRPARATKAIIPSEPELEPLLAGTRTDLGGLFYLLNLALALGLYGDFTRPLDRPLRLDPWDFIALLGRELLRGTRARDPVWALLAQLAGRAPEDAPGAHFRPPRDVRLPPAWIEPFGGDARLWRFTTTGGRLRIRHPARFTVVDVPLGRNPRLHLARALRPYGSPACAPGRFGREPESEPLERWLAHLAAYARARLQLALGVDGRALAQTMLVQPARVFVTATQVDVVAQLEDLAVEVRFAGLDRDPGWIPAAGRDVRFHFE